jgi:hypothetical protein
MRLSKLAPLAVLFLACASSANAQGQRVFPNRTTTGADVAINNVGSGIAYHLLTWNEVVAAATCEVKIEQAAAAAGPWSDLIGTQDCTANGQSSVTNVVANFIRINVTTLTGGGTVTARWNGFVTNPSGGGGPPGGDDGEVQFNDAGAFGGISGLINGLSVDCDGFGSPCALLHTTPTMDFIYSLLMRHADAPMGSYGSLFFGSAASTGLDAWNGTEFSGLTLFPGGASTISQDDIAMGLSRASLRFTVQPRFAVGAAAAYRNESTDFALSSGWGNTATVVSNSGTDSVMLFTVTAGGTGIAANPTITYTYTNGDWDFGTPAAANTVAVYTCQQVLGTGIVADVTLQTTGATTTTALTWIWNGTPTAGDTYRFMCMITGVGGTTVN